MEVFLYFCYDAAMKRLRKIIVEKSVQDLTYTQRIINNLPHLPVEIVDDAKDLFQEFQHAKNPITEGKKVLVLEKNKGAFLKPFPGTKNYIYCGHYVLNFATQCNLECSYCILQSYLNNPAMRIFVNLDDLFEELKTKVDGHPDQFFRISTGVFTDSLSLEPITRFHETIIPFFTERENVILELKSKATHIDFLEKFPGNQKVMMSFSINSERIQKEEEKKTDTIIERILAAKKCLENGYLINFHFDPMIYYEGWEADYQKTIDLIYDHIDPDKINWISMGCLRFMPELKEVVGLRHPRSTILYGEFLKGLDGKMRYPKPLRIKIYKKMAEMLNFSNYKYKIYLCMESDEVWRKSLGFSPKNKEGLQSYLNDAFAYA